MTAMATERTIEELVAAMVTADGFDRAMAYRDVINAGFAGIRCVDVRCGDRVMTLAQLYRHLIATDNVTLIDQRGFRMHTPINVTLFDPETGGRGPGMAGPT